MHPTKTKYFNSFEETSLEIEILFPKIIAIRGRDVKINETTKEVALILLKNNWNSAYEKNRPKRTRLLLRNEIFEWIEIIKIIAKRNKCFNPKKYG